MIEITIFPMKNDGDGSATLCEPPDDPEFYDVLVRDDGDVVAETEDLMTYEEAIAVAEKYLAEFPDAEIDFGD